MDQYGLDFNRMESTSCIPFCAPVLDTGRMDTWRERAKAQLKEKGLSQEWLAERFDMTAAGMQKWLAGTRQPTLDDINRVADELQCPRSWLTHGIKPEDTVDGLGSVSRSVLRKLIQMERSVPLPDSFWAAIDAMANTVAPPPAVVHHKSGDDPRNGTQHG